MIDEATGEPHTYHTTQPVPLFIIGGGDRSLRPSGVLADVAPTVLELMGIPRSPEMTGQSLIEPGLD
jgi:2,3-bisphosphoglycerate-independent phosphoglycerate mutase